MVSSLCLSKMIQLDVSLRGGGVEGGAVNSHHQKLSLNSSVSPLITQWLTV